MSEATQALFFFGPWWKHVHAKICVRDSTEVARASYAFCLAQSYARGVVFFLWSLKMSHPAGPGRPASHLWVGVGCFKI